ncbi:MAG: hypothetical protein WC688_04310 [Parachlamydiales bacterium]
MTSYLIPTSGIKIGSDIAKNICSFIGLNSPTASKTKEFAKGFLRRIISTTVTYGPVQAARFFQPMSWLTLPGRLKFASIYNGFNGVASIGKYVNACISHKDEEKDYNLKMSLQFLFRASVDWAVLYYCHEETLSYFVLAEGILQAVLPQQLNQTSEKIYNACNKVFKNTTPPKVDTELSPALKGVLKVTFNDKPEKIDDAVYFECSDEEEEKKSSEDDTDSDDDLILPNNSDPQPILSTKTEETQTEDLITETEPKGKQADPQPILSTKTEETKTEDLITETESKGKQADPQLILSTKTEETQTEDLITETKPKGKQADPQPILSTKTEETQTEDLKAKIESQADPIAFKTTNLTDAQTQYTEDIKEGTVSKKTDPLIIPPAENKEPQTIQSKIQEESTTEIKGPKKQTSETAQQKTSFTQSRAYFKSLDNPNSPVPKPQNKPGTPNSSSVPLPSEGRVLNYTTPSKK